MGKTSIACIDNHAIIGVCFRVAHPGLEPCGKISGVGLPRLDLEGSHDRTTLEDDVDLGADIISPEENIRIESLVESRLEELRNDKGLEEVAAVRVDEELLRVLYSEEPCGDASVDELDIRTFHKAFPEVAMVRLEKIDNAARLEYGKPGPGCIMREPAVESERAQVEDLSHPRGAHLHEGLELPEILHVDDRAHIALDIRGYRQYVDS
jgi:hypothetical protein